MGRAYKETRGVVLRVSDVLALEVEIVGNRIDDVLAIIKGLWYLRSDLMTTLAADHGENKARLEMTDITSAFADALPRDMKSRARAHRDLS